MSTLMGESVAHHNLRSIVRVVRGAGAVSRREVARSTGLSTPTVTRHVSELVEAGVLRLIPARDGENSGPGRPAREVGLEPGFGHVLGVDVGEHTLRLAVADFAGDVLLTRRCSAWARDGREASLDRLVDAIRGILDGAGLTPADGRLQATAIGVPGIIEVDDGVVVDAPNLLGWRDLPLRRVLQERLNLGTSVRIENDVNLAAVGESAQGAGKGHEDFVFVSVRRGIGAGVFLDGRLRRGRAGMAGEIGFMASSHEFDHRRADGHGHLETTAGEHALLQRAKDKNPVRWTRSAGSAASTVAGTEAAAETGTAAGTETRTETEEDDLSVRHLCLAAAEGEPAASEVLEEAFQRYGVAVANIVAVLDPELVVLGGDLAVIGDRAVERIGEVLHRLVPHAPALRSSVLGEDAALQGALHQAHLDACDAMPSVIHPV